ncbi:MAG: 16S rRNA (cytosine(967)-C(5))-methyltransferase RsmB, partial [Gammaproteobacteria bacterium]|nr:16S rRNA (cytosine(967)-C(5))-methyltransferase RsmB [Gammaproteobacteria bacterium]
HPLWLIHVLQRDWPAQWPVIVAANNRRPPLALRVNRRLVSRHAYLAELAGAGLSATLSPWCAAGVVLDRPVPVERLPGFAAGRVSVQDIAAQLVGALLDLAPGQRVLDACAAPGGKAAHALEIEPGIDLLALEKDPQRAARMQATFIRLQLVARCRTGDARCPQSWHDGLGFDRILVDAPCSGTGVIRRHPDIKHLRRAADIGSAVRVQTEILDALWPLLRPGGRLVYVTCSILAEENQGQVAALVARFPDARAEPVDLPVGAAAGLGHQVLPGDADLDGFFYAALTRTH